MIKTLKDWLVMMSVAASILGIFGVKDDTAALAGMLSLIFALVLGHYLEKLEKSEKRERRR
jgi:hypothetical protein